MKHTLRLSMLSAALAVRSLAQQPSLQTHSPSDVSEAHQLSLNVIVTDRSGAPVPNLETSEFRLFENQSPAKLASVHLAATVEIALVLDAVNTSHDDLARAIDQLRSFLTSRAPRLARPLSVLVVSDVESKLKPTSAPGPTSSTITALADHQVFVRRLPASFDVATILQALDRLELGSRRISDAQGGEGEAERVRLSLVALNFIVTARGEDPAPKILISISPGWPLLAHSAARTDEQLFNSIVYFSRLLRDAHVTLDVLSPAGLAPPVQAPGLPPLQVVNGSAVRVGPTSIPSVDTTPSLYESFFKPARSTHQSNPNDLALQVLAHQSGGFVSPPGNTIAPHLARAMAEADALYVLSLDLPAPSGLTQFHDLEVMVTRHGLEIHVPSGYYSR